LEDELIESKVSEEEIEYCMFTSQNFAMLASLVDVEVIERYINQITPQMDGTLDAILERNRERGDRYQGREDYRRYSRQWAAKMREESRERQAFKGRWWNRLEIGG
jgi:hypothetical protein